MRRRKSTKNKIWTATKSRRKRSSHRCQPIQASPQLTWTPDLFGPVFTKEKISLRQALQTHHTDKRTRLMASFVPDELIYALDLTKKNYREFVAVLLLVDVSGFNRLWQKYNCAENSGSSGFSSVLNFCVSLMVENIYSFEGDVVNITTEEVLAMWKVRKDEFVTKTIDTVIACALRVKQVLQDIGSESKSVIKAVKMAISSGPVIFSVIGTGNSRNFVLVGNPVVEVRNMKKKDWTSGDLIVTLSAWENVSPQSYEFVLQDARSVKIIGLSESTSKSDEKPGPDLLLIDDKFPRTSRRKIESLQEQLHGEQEKDPNTRNLDSSIDESDLERKIFTGRFSMAEATRRQLGNHLKSFIHKSVLQQIENDFPLEQLTENRRVMVLVMDLESRINTVYDLLTLVDECYVLLHREVTNYNGSLSGLVIDDTAIRFVMAFGSDPSILGEARDGLLCVEPIVTALKNISRIGAISVGISTGMAYCGVIGHMARMNYVLFGRSIEKANEIALVSNDEIICDFDTIIYSGLPRNRFYSRGMKELKGSGQCHLYQFVNEIPTNAQKSAYLDYVYPILGRFEESEIFSDILDDICTPGKEYSGILVEGPERIGKSRLLDDFARVAESRQISVYRLQLDEINVSKPYVTIYNLILQLLGANDFKTEEERERLLTKKLCAVARREDFCYMNIILRMAYPLSMDYQSENQETRFLKSLKLFDAIIRPLKKPKCIMLDDAEFVDGMSWPFISRLTNINHVVLVMSMETAVLSENLTESNIPIANDEKIYRHVLKGLEPDYLSALVCQFLNVRAIPGELDAILRAKSENHPGWCEAFISLMLQNKSIILKSLTPDEFSLKNLVFPQASLIEKIPKDLSPDETSSEFSYRQERGVKVCLISNEFTGDAGSILKFNQIGPEIYNRSTIFEKYLMQCAAVLGKTFTRNALEHIFPGHKSHDTARAVARMINLRIFECASLQRRDFRFDDSMLCVYQNRTTFSDMHHSTKCNCPHSGLKGTKRSLQHSECKLLEFKSKSFKKYVASTLEVENEFISKFVETFERNARKCAACGGGSFFRMLGQEKPASHMASIETSTIRPVPRRISSQKISPRINRKTRSFLTVSDDGARKPSTEKEVRRISIMPTHSNTDEESMSSLDLERVSVCIESFSGADKSENSIEFRKRTLRNYPIVLNDPSRLSHLRNFSHIDYRNCQCFGIVDSLFWQLYQQLKDIENFDRLARFVIDYGAGLIRTGQSFQAMTLLTLTHDKIKHSRNYVDFMVSKQEYKGISRGPFLLLMGDASVNLGNYQKARQFYDEAVRLCINTRNSVDKFCISYRIWDQACKRKLHEKYPDTFINRITGQEVATKINAAVYLSRLSSILLKVGEKSTSKLKAFESFNHGFACSGSFFEKCDIYVRIVNIFRDLGEFAFAQSLEKSMIYTIRSKQWWSDVEEVTIVANVFKSIFEMRLLGGEYEDALIMGIKVLKISSELKMSRTKLSILPQLIQLTAENFLEQIRTKRIHETVDLMRELYHSASEDIDESAITWYFALALDLALDAGMVLDSFENCARHAQKMIGTSHLVECVFRDPDSLRRLLTCLWLWQLRMNVPPTFAEYSTSYTMDVRGDNFNELLTMMKALECHLLTLTRCINMKKADNLGSLIDEIERVVRILEKKSKAKYFVKPRLSMLEGYLEIVRGRKTAAMRYLRKAAKFAENQSNRLMLAWIVQNEKMWRLNTYNNMANYWVEHVGFNDTVDWQNMHCFNVKMWSSILFPIPVPDTSI